MSTPTEEMASEIGRALALSNVALRRVQETVRLDPSVDRSVAEAIDALESLLAKTPPSRGLTRT